MHCIVETKISAQNNSSVSSAQLCKTLVIQDKAIVAVILRRQISAISEPAPCGTIGLEL